MPRAIILSEYCKGCGLCASFCPKKLLQQGSERNQAGAFYPVLSAPDECIGCGVCALMCPDAAIEIREASNCG